MARDEIRAATTQAYEQDNHPNPDPPAGLSPWRCDRVRLRGLRGAQRGNSLLRSFELFNQGLGIRGAAGHKR